MIALDTNILIRFLVKDDKKQAEFVYQKFKQAELEQEVFFIPLLVILEVVWVLQSAYHISDKDILRALSQLLLMPILNFEKQSVIQTFVTSNYDTKFDLSDLLIGLSATTSNCEFVFTFDKKAAKLKYFKHFH